MEAAIADTQSVYLQEYEQLAGTRPGWLSALQQRGIQAFERQGFPSRRLEAWRKTDLSAVTARHLPRAPAPGTVGPALTEEVTRFEGHRVVFVDGVFAPELSDLEALPRGLTVASLAEYTDEAPSRLTQALGDRADLDGHPFIALNTGLFGDGVFINAAAGALIEQPVVLVYVTTADAAGHAVYPRSVTNVEAGAELRVTERYVSADATDALVVPCSEVHAAQDAVVDYHRLQEEGDAVSHIGGFHVTVARNASARVHALSAGAKLARVDYYADLDGEGADARLNGLYLTEGRQFSDQHTYVNHRTVHGTSNQFFRGILRGRSETVFDGLVRVFEGAQKTDAQQQNRNLVLDKMALAHSNPRLEIHADDVKCAHGSTVGELDAEALFYLRSRGVDTAQAQSLLTLAFADEVLEQMRDTAVADHVRKLVLSRLPGGELVKETT